MPVVFLAPMPSSTHARQRGQSMHERKGRPHDVRGAVDFGGMVVPFFSFAFVQICESREMLAGRSISIWVSGYALPRGKHGAARGSALEKM